MISLKRDKIILILSGGVRVKRLLYLLTGLVFTVCLTGCGVELSEEQNRIMAEYAADLLLQYDANYQSRLVEVEDESDIQSTTEATTEDVTEDSGTEEPGSSTEAGDGEGSSTEALTSEVTDIAEILGLEGVSITYAERSFVDYYPPEEQEAYVDLTADEGYKLMVLQFRIQNQSSQEVELDLLHKQLEYQLLVNGTQSAKPMLTILTEDLGTYQGTISPESEQTAVLVFQISEGLVDKVETIDLRIKNQEQNYVIHMQ